MKEILGFILILNGCLYSTSEALKRFKRETSRCDCGESKDCKLWVDSIKVGKYLNLPICGFHSVTHTPLLCCPRSKRTLRRSIREIQNLEGINNLQLSCKVTSGLASPIQKAKEKCAEYGKLIFQRLFEVSIGDEPYKKELVDTCVKADEDEDQAKSREFPHMALIGFGEKKEWLCAGSLISERYILGVAHCAKTPRHGNAAWAKLGDLDISTDDDVARPQIYKITETIVHPEYKPPENYHDIGLYKLEKDIDFSIYVRPACLYTRRDPPDSIADATGWGRTSYGGPTSSLLKKIKVQLVNKEECDKTYNTTAISSRVLKNGINHDSMFCSVEYTPQGQKICTGDSGGPLQVPLKTPYCMYGLIGITSFGIGCNDGIPAVNTRVSYYVPWIVENVWPDDE